MSALFRRIIALLMVCVLVFVCSPIQAEATGLEIGLLYGDDIIYIFTSILIGLGIIAAPAWYEATAHQMVSDIEEELTINPDSVLSVNFGFGFDAPSPEDSLYLKVLKRANQLGKLMVASEVLEWCWNWLFESAILKLEGTSSYNGGVEFIYSPDLSDEVISFWGDIDIYNAAGSANVGDILMLSTNSATSPNYAFGLQRLSTSYGIDVLTVRGDSFLLAPYTSLDFPVGQFVQLDKFPANTLEYVSNSNTYGSATSMVFLNYDDAVAAYSSSNFDLNHYFYLTPESVFIPYTSTASSTGFSDVAISRIVNLGRLSSGGSVDVGTYNIIIGSGYNSYRYVFAPTFTKGKSVITEEPDVALGEVADPDIPFSAGYANWYTNQLLDAGTVYLPVGTFEDYSANSKLTQEQVWTGSVYPEFPVFDREIAPAFIYYNLGDKAAPLAVDAVSPDGGVITYQWYVNGFPIEGAVTSSIVPSTSKVGVFQYVCYVTNARADNPVLSSSTNTFPVNVQVLYENGTETPPEVDPNAEAFQNSIAGSKTELDSLTGSLADAAVPNYMGHIDLGFNKVFDSDGLGTTSPGFGLLANVFEPLFLEGDYIYWVFMFAFSLAAISFVIFGKRG